MQVTAVTRGHLLPFPLFLNMKRNFALHISWWAGFPEMCHAVQKKTATPLIDDGQFCGNASTSVRRLKPLSTPASGLPFPCSGLCSWMGSVRSYQVLHHDLQLVDFVLRCRQTRFFLAQFFLQLLVQALDRGQGNAALVDIGDVPVVFADVEGGEEILRHGADVADGGHLRLIVPGSDGQGQHAGEKLKLIHRRKAVFRIAVADRGPGTAAGSHLNTRHLGAWTNGADLEAGYEFHPAGGTGEKLVCGNSVQRRTVAIRPYKCAELVIGAGAATRSKAEGSAGNSGPAAGHSGLVAAGGVGIASAHDGKRATNGVGIASAQGGQVSAGGVGIATAHGGIIADGGVVLASAHGGITTAGGVAISSAHGG